MRLSRRGMERKGQALKAVGYVRVSTDEQVSEGISLENQEARIEAYAKSQGWNLVGIYREAGYSGKMIERPELTRLIHDVKAGGIDAVLVYKVDRLTRRQRDLWYLLEDVFEAYQVGFKSIIEPFDTTTAQGKAFLGMLAVFAQLERDTISERTKDTLSHKRESGEWVGRIPFGFRVGEEKRLVEDPEGMALIQKAKRMRNQGLSYREIAKRLGVSLGYVHKVLNTNLRAVKACYLREKRGNAVHKPVG